MADAPGILRQLELHLQALRPMDGKGVWRRMRESFADDPDMEFILIDSTVARAHHSAAGALRKRGVSRPKPSEGAEADSARKSTRRLTSAADRCG